MPKSILSDRGPQFISSFWQELLERVGVKSWLTSPYHPQGDGQTERTQRTWLQYLRMYAKEKNWVSWLTPIEFAYNSAVHEATGFTPFSLSRTYLPLTGMEPGRKENPWRHNIETAKENLKKARKRMIAHSSSKPTSYQVRDHVWLSMANCQLQGNIRFQPKWFGPFEVIEVMTNACRLRLPSTIKLHPVINALYLKKYVEQEDDDPIQILKEPKLLD